MAVQLAKLSLWRLQARDLPFTFQDHSFRHGMRWLAWTYHGLPLEAGEAAQLSRGGDQAVCFEVVAVRFICWRLNRLRIGQKLNATSLRCERRDGEGAAIPDVCAGAILCPRLIQGG